MVFSPQYIVCHTELPSVTQRDVEGTGNRPRKEKATQIINIHMIEPDHQKRNLTKREKIKVEGCRVDIINSFGFAGGMSTMFPVEKPQTWPINIKKKNKKMSKLIIKITFMKSISLISQH